jgi:hypothetical protein
MQRGMRHTNTRGSVGAMPDTELSQLREELLRRLDVPVPPDQGEEAFERHQLLAIRFHRAARLNAPQLGDRRGWIRYFVEHFPRGANHADRLWSYWRLPLLKDELPGPQVVIAQAQPFGHWKVLPPAGQLFVNLETMRDDFRASVESLIALLESDEERWEATLQAWRTRRWTVQSFQVPIGPTVSGSVTSGAATAASREST